MARQFASVSRRTFLGSAAAGSLAWVVPGAFAEELARTPHQTEGPFYPDKLPLDTDNDLILLNDTLTPAVGEVTHLTGRILGSNGEPLRNAVVEIWQCDAGGAYLHSRTVNANRRDGNFQGFGRFLTGSSGEYYFRTIKPVPYPGRSPHIHFMIKHPGQDEFTTQCYIKGHPQNDRDFAYRGAGDEKQRALLCADFVPLVGSTAGELQAKFDVVLGYTPKQS
jgi:protocatechuate 3,4-dioxygenase beta subunit